VAAERPGGARGVQGAANRIHHGADLLMHRPPRETQGLEAFAAQNRVTNGIALPLRRFVVVRSVDLECQPSVEADKIEDVASKWGLPTNVEPLGPQLSKARPKPNLGLAHDLPQGSCANHAHGEAPPDRFAATLPIEGRESIQ